MKDGHKNNEISISIGGAMEEKPMLKVANATMNAPKRQKGDLEGVLVLSDHFLF
jgi:hypothetical protein